MPMKNLFQNKVLNCLPPAGGRVDTFFDCRIQSQRGPMAKRERQNLPIKMEEGGRMAEGVRHFGCTNFPANEDWVDSLGHFSSAKQEKCRLF